MSKKDFIVGLDIGTTKICCIVGEVTGETASSTSSASAPHLPRDLRKGVVINIDSTVESITKAVEEAELMAGVEISTVYTGIAGGHIKSFNSTGIVAVKDKEITEQDVQPRDRRRQGRRDPARPRSDPHHSARIHDRRSGRHPRSDRHERRSPRSPRFTSSRARFRAPRTSSSAPTRPASTWLRSASSRSHRPKPCLLPTRRTWASLLVDIGGGTSDIAIFKDGAIVHTGVLAIGGNHLTNDIAVGLRTPQNEAEKIKITSRLRDVQRSSRRTRPSKCRAWAAASRASSPASCSPRSSSRAWKRFSRSSSAK